VHRAKRRWVVGTVVCTLAPLAARAQEPVWDARVVHTTAPIRLDGSLAEAVWLTADSITAALAEGMKIAREMFQQV